MIIRQVKCGNESELKRVDETRVDEQSDGHRLAGKPEGTVHVPFSL